MIDVAEFEPDAATFELPDVPQVNVMMDALDDSIEQIDMVEGTEAISFTKAQQYAQGVLYSNGIIPLRAMCGMEEGGVFSSIGDGIGAVWSWIKGIFTSIWNFFFSRDNKEEADKTKAEADANSKTASDAANGSQSDEDAKKQAGKMAGIASAGGDEATAKALKEAKTPKEIKAAIKAALPKIAKLNAKGKQKIQNSIKLAVQAKLGFAKIVNDDSNKKFKDAQDKVAGTDHPVAHLMIDLEAHVDKILVKDNTFIPTLEKAMDCDTVPKVMAFNTTMKSNVDAMKALGDGFDQNKGKMKTILDTTEKKLKAAKDAKNKAELKKEVATIRVLMNWAVKTSKLIQISNNRLRTVSDDLNAMFGL